MNISVWTRHGIREVDAIQVGPFHVHATLGAIGYTVAWNCFHVRTFDEFFEACAWAERHAAEWTDATTRLRNIAEAP